MRGEGGAGGEGLTCVGWLGLVVEGWGRQTLAARTERGEGRRGRGQWRGDPGSPGRCGEEGRGEERRGDGRGERVGPVGQLRTLAARRERRGEGGESGRREWSGEP
jgi:hypothetical protein